MAEAESLSTSRPTPWSEAGWLRRPLQMCAMRTIVQSPAGTSHLSVPSGAMRDVRSTTSFLRTTWSGAVGTALIAMSLRDPKVLATMSGMRILASGCASSILMSTVVVKTSLTARAESGAGNGWKRSE